MFKIRSRRENESRRHEGKLPAEQNRRTEAKPRPLDAETLKHVGGGFLPRGGWAQQ